MMKYRHTATVEGRGLFPIDMLRYDHCYPASEQDSYAINQREDVRQVKVIMMTDSKLMPFTERRWESFTWRLVDCETEKQS